MTWENVSTIPLHLFPNASRTPGPGESPYRDFGPNLRFREAYTVSRELLASAVQLSIFGLPIALNYVKHKLCSEPWELHAERKRALAIPIAIRMDRGYAENHRSLVPGLLLT